MALWKNFFNDNDQIYLLAVKRIQIQKGTDETVCAALRFDDFQAVTRYAYYGRLAMQIYSWTVLALSGILIIICLYFIAVLNSNQDNAKKVFGAKIYL